MVHNQPQTSEGEQTPWHTNQEADAVELHAPDNDVLLDEQKPLACSRKANTRQKGKQTCTQHRSIVLKDDHELNHQLLTPLDFAEREQARQENREAECLLEQQEIKAKILQEWLQAQEKDKKQ